MDYITENDYKNEKYVCITNLTLQKINHQSILMIIIVLYEIDGWDILPLAKIDILEIVDACFYYTQDI